MGFSKPFLQRVSIACYAERCISYSKSVCPSVRPSHAGTVSKRLKQSSCMGSSLGDSPIDSSSFMLNFTAKFQREHTERGRE